MKEPGLAPDARCHICNTEAELSFGGATWCRDCYHAQGQTCRGWRLAKPAGKTEKEPQHGR